MICPGCQQEHSDGDKCPPTDGAVANDPLIGKPLGDYALVRELGRGSAGVVYLGFNVNQPAGSSTFTTLAPAGTSLVVTYTKVSGPATIRVQIQAGANRWCANLTASPATIPYTSFNLMCWETAPPATGAYAKQPIEAVQLVAPGGEMAQPIDMTLVSVKDM